MIVRELLTRLGFTIDNTKVKQAEDKIDGIKHKANDLVGAVYKVGAVIAVAFSAGRIIEAADAWASVEARVALATDEIKEQEKVMDRLFSIAQETRQEFTATADLYSKVNRGAKELGMSQSNVLQLTETINKALVVGGGQTHENQAAILQLGQALASGTLQGEELRSILENSPRLARAIAEGMGVSVGKLRELGRQGELTSKEVAVAILSQMDKINQEFKKMPLTVGQATIYARNAWGRFINKIEKDSHVFSSMARGIVWLTDKIINGLNEAADAFGGWGKLLKTIGLLMMSFGAGLMAYGLIKYLSKIQKGFAAIMVVLSNPVFLAVALAVAALILVIEDLYTWLNGGQSVIGSWLESMGISAEEFKNGLTAIVEFIKGFIIATFEFLANSLRSTIKFILAVMTGDWSSALEAWKGFLIGLFYFFTDILKSLGLVSDNSVKAFVDAWNAGLAKVDGFFTRMYNWGAEKINGLIELANKLPLIELPTISLKTAGTSGKGSNNINQNVKVTNKFGNGTPAQQAGFVAKAAEVNYKSNYGQIVRALQFSKTE